MKTRESLNFNSEKEKKEPTIVIRKSAEAPEEVKKNPFFDPEIWGRANSPDDIYLPDSDEALSFPWAAHEIGHLVKKDEIEEATLDNFEATRAEERRAWNKGWQYLKKYVAEYYQNEPRMIALMEDKFQRIKELATQAVDLSAEMYLPDGSLADIDDYGEFQTVLRKQREKIAATETGKDIKHLIEEMKKEKIGRKPAWDKFVEVVTKAIEDILKDNEE